MKRFRWLTVFALVCLLAHPASPAWAQQGDDSTESGASSADEPADRVDDEIVVTRRTSRKCPWQ